MHRPRPPRPPRAPQRPASAAIRPAAAQSAAPVGSPQRRPAQSEQCLRHQFGVPAIAHHAPRRDRTGAALHKAGHPSGDRRARPIISMLTRRDPPTTCSRPVSPGRLTRTQTGLSQPCSARTEGSNATPSWAAASAYRLARTMIRSPPRRSQGRNHRLRCHQSRCCNPGRSVRHDLAAKPGGLGGMHLGIHPQGERRGPPTRPKTVTSPDATDDHRHQLRSWMIRPQPPCRRRHRLVPAKRPTQRPHRRNLVFANHSPKRCPIRARRPEVL